MLALPWQEEVIPSTLVEGNQQMRAEVSPSYVYFGMSQVLLRINFICQYLLAT